MKKKEVLTKYTPRGSYLSVALMAIRREKSARSQKTFVYCPRCNFELCSMDGAYIDEDDKGIVIYVCKNCGAGTHF
jgi:transcription elongation factor Elf1